jgi:hypothetical protein
LHDSEEAHAVYLREDITDRILSSPVHEINMVLFILSIGAINALVPILVIIILIGAAAGLTRGFSFLDLFSIGTFMGMGSGKSAKASLARSGFNRQLSTTTQTLTKKQIVPALKRRRSMSKAKKANTKEDYYNVMYQAPEKSKFVKFATTSGVLASKAVFRSPFRKSVTSVAAPVLSTAKSVRNAVYRSRGMGYKTPSKKPGVPVTTALEDRIALHEELLKRKNPLTLPFPILGQKNLRKNYEKLKKAKEDIYHPNTGLIARHHRELQDIQTKHSNIADPVEREKAIRKSQKELDKKYSKEFKDIYNKSVYSRSTNRIVFASEKLVDLGAVRTGAKTHRGKLGKNT